MVLLRFAGAEMSPELDAILKRDPESLTEDEAQVLVNQGATAVRGFFEAATDGFEFVPRERIAERFGTTLAANYPEAGPTFLRMANTYWTLKLVLSDAWEDRGTAGYAILSSIESNVGALFFPTPGPIKIDPKKRAADQREFLAGAAPRMNVEEFIAHNPILQRDRLAQGSGCLLIPLLLVQQGVAAIATIGARLGS